MTAPDKHGQWQPIETAPKDGREFLCLWKTSWMAEPQMVIARWLGSAMSGPNFYGINVKWLDGKGSISPLSGGFQNTLFATHWQPLPEPPK